MQYRIIDTEGQRQEVAKSEDDIFVTAFILGLGVSFLGGSKRFIKVAAQPEQQDKLDALLQYLDAPPAYSIS
ncbi:hypothetical protein [Rhizobium leguminosarum]|uniref:hypothetical protein n=1 Tax=Rhizobium leguminosarum TaxID=384 RepID=UPI0015F95429|nr:hypothetical protein [Rhizobium leguminosarum]MBA9036725.1 hypothetical protein [Rhizobium leguminosarum]